MWRLDEGSSGPRVGGTGTAGDQDAYEILVRERARPLLGVAYRILRDQDAAEDAVQAALVRIWRELPRLRDPDRFEPWTLRIVVRASLERRPDHPLASLDAGRSRHRALHPGRRARDVDPDELDGAFRRLSTEHRVVVVLHHYLGYSIGEIAESPGCPVHPGRSAHVCITPSAKLRSTLTREERLANYEARRA